MEKVTTESIVLTCIIIAALIALLYFIKNFLIKIVAYKGGKKKRNTLLGMIFNILQYVVIIAAIFVILTVNGINVTGMLAGLGIAATIIGLSLQDTFKDLFAGINIYSNNFYKVGDFVKYNGEMCEVKFFNARISKFRSIANGSTYTVSNSSISGIEKIKDGCGVFFYFPFDTDRKVIDKCLKVATKTCDEMVGTTNVEYLSITEIDKIGVKYMICFSASPAKQFFIKMGIYQKAYEEFKKAGIAPLFVDTVIS